MPETVRLAAALDAWLFDGRREELRACVSDDVVVLDGDRRLRGRAARAWVLQPRPGLLQRRAALDGAAGARTVVAMGELGGEIWTVLARVRRGEIAKLTVARSPWPGSREDVHEGPYDAELAALGWTPPASDALGHRWSALRALEPALPALPWRDWVWQQGPALYVLTPWVGIQALLCEGPDGPVHRIGTMGHHPPPVPAWAWARGLSLAPDGGGRRQRLVLAHPMPPEALAKVQTWTPACIPHRVGHGHFAYDADFHPAWDVLYEAEQAGQLHVVACGPCP